MIELGGNIILQGFETLDHADLLIAKKLVGSYVRKLCDEAGGCDKAEIMLEQLTEEYVVKTKISLPNKIINAQAQGTNLFMTIDKALKQVLKQIGIII